MSTTLHSSLAALAASPQASGIWWSAVAKALDALAERLELDAVVDSGPGGALEMAVTDDPTLASRANNAAAQRMALQVRVFELRQMVTRVAGAPDSVDEVAHRLGAVAEAEVKYQRRVRAVVWDSVALDIGGE